MTAGAFFQDNIGYSVTWEQDSTEELTTHGWMIGYDTTSQSPPVSIIEGSLLHALHRVRRYLGAEQSSHTYRYIGVQAGSAETEKSLERWAATGELALESCFASDIIDTLEKLVAELRCTLVINELPEGYFDKARLTGQTGPDVIYATAARMQKHIIKQAWSLWGERMARIPWTPAETKERLKCSYLEDELKAIKMLAEIGSTSCTIYRELSLNRQIIKAVLKALRKDRRQQVTWAAIICATRYKVYEDNRSYPVKCEVRPDCKEEDSLKHMLKCCEIER